MKNPVYEQIQARKVKARHAHAVACAARERQRQSDLPLLWCFQGAFLYLEEAL
jgi:hypothetical protein